MSIINQVLKDLEKRERKPVNSDALVFFVPKNQKNKFFTYKKTSVLLSCFFIFFTFISFVLFVPKSNVNKNIINKISAISLDVQQDVTSLGFLLDKKVFYKVNFEKKANNVLITLPNTNLLAGLPAINELHTALRRLEIQKNNNDLIIILGLKTDAIIRKLGIVTHNNSPELKINIFHQEKKIIYSRSNQIFPSQKIVPMGVKKIVQQTPVEKIYKIALSYIDQGKNQKAILILQQLISQFPGFNQGREALAKLLIQNDNAQLAEIILQKGLEIQPNYYPFVELKARILVARGEVNKALDLLQQGDIPSIKTNPEYHAFIAALYQQEGNSMLAARLYQELLSIEPKQGLWWLGLGIAYENLGKNIQAQDAYLRAENTDSLSPELHAFIETKIHNV